MVDLDWKAKMVTSDMSNKSPKLSDNTHRSAPSPARVGDTLRACPSATSAYERYLHIPELQKLWSSKDFPSWESERLLKPALQALEITFRLISNALSDSRPYANRDEWARRLESLAVRQIELIATLCEEEEETRGGAPIVDLCRSDGLLSREGSAREVWTVAGESLSVVSRGSEASLLPRLATWRRSEGIAKRIAAAIECHMARAPFTLGLGEPNLSQKPNLDYDLVCRPSDLHSLKKPPKPLDNYENAMLCATHQILEAWIFSARELLRRIGVKIDGRSYAAAASDCWLAERIWKLLSDIQDLHILMDPDDFLRLKSQLSIGSSNSNGSDSSEPFCFRSAALIDLMWSSRDLRRRVPEVLGVEVDPRGGPRVQEAAMRLFFQGKTDGGDWPKIHLMQAFQAIESAMKRFFYGYWQLIVVTMGSLEAKGNRGLVGSGLESSDPLTQMFLDQPYFPSLDGAKTFLGDFWQHEVWNSNSNGCDKRIK